MKILILGLIILISVPLKAEVTLTAEKIPENLHVYDTYGHAYVDLEATSCSGKRYKLKSDHAKYDAIFSILLSAQTAKKKVQVRFDGCNSIGIGHIVGVYLKD